MLLKLWKPFQVFQTETPMSIAAAAMNTTVKNRIIPPDCMNPRMSASFSKSVSASTMSLSLNKSGQ